MKRALVLAICLLLAGAAVGQAEKERSNPFHHGPQPADPTRSYFEGFESAVPPAGWTLTSTAGHTQALYTTWYQESYDPFENYYYADCQYDSAYLSPQDEWLKFSATITAPDNHLNFAAYASYYWMVTPYANYDLQVTVNGTMLWSMQADPTWNLSWTYYIFDVDLTAYEGQTVEIGFGYIGYDGAEAGLDAVGLNSGYTPPPSGACCDPLGACTFVQEGSCYAPSVWHGDWVCAPVNPCPAPPVPANDTCAGAIQIPCGPFTISATTFGATNDYNVVSSACTGYSITQGPDVTYYVDMSVGDIFQVTMTTTGWDDAIYLVKDCANMATCVAGDDAYPDGSTFVYVVPAGGAGRYYLIVDGYSSSAYGDFTITGTANCVPPVPVEETNWGTIKALYR